MPHAVQFDRSQVLDAAMAVFWAQGFDAVGIRDLEAATGLKASSLYNSFGNKEAIYRTCVQHYIDTLVQKRLARMDQKSNCRKAIIDFLFDQFNDAGRQSLPKSCFIGNSHMVAGRLSADVQDLIQDGQAQIDQAFLRMIERGQHAHEIRADLPAHLIADHLSMASTGLFVRQAELAEPERRQALARAVEALIAPPGTA